MKKNNFLVIALLLVSTAASAQQGKTQKPLTTTKPAPAKNDSIPVVKPVVIKTDTIPSTQVVPVVKPSTKVEIVGEWKCDGSYTEYYARSSAEEEKKSIPNAENGVTVRGSKMCNDIEPSVSIDKLQDEVVDDAKRTEAFPVKSNCTTPTLELINLYFRDLKPTKGSENKNLKCIRDEKAIKALGKDPNNLPLKQKWFVEDEIKTENAPKTDAAREMIRLCQYACKFTNWYLKSVPEQK